ncbi:ABC transporter substrate-binding protein [Luteococcus peritonei]|uniref:ABC transporter substrate-binding protein n=1 Tax=Luteococcus peritonei TaxID=88874 RepID=A0ABW4RW84_9ACTN
MTQLSRRGLVAGALGALALSGCNGTAVRQAEQSASPKVSTPGAGLPACTIGLTYIPNIQFAPFYWAQEKGLFTRRGARVTLRHHGADEGLFTALTSGQEDFVIAGGDEVVQANAEGMDLVTVAGYYQRYPIVMIVREDSPITSLAQLKGRTVGIPGEYGESWFGLQVALRTAGLARTDLTIQSIGYTQQAALATRKVDAIVGFSNNDVVQFATNGVAVRQIPLADEIPLVSSSIVTTRATLESQPELVEQVCRGIVESVQGVVADPQAAITTSIAHIPGLDAATAQKNALTTLKATIPLWKGEQEVPELKLSADRFVEMADFMHQAGLISRKVDGSRAVDASVLA